MKNLKLFLVMFSLLFSTLSFADEELDNELISAVIENNIEEVKKLLNQGAKVNSIDVSVEGNFSILAEAITNEYYELAKFLIEKEADANLGDYPALIEAVKVENLELVKLLIAKNADINIENKWARTALDYAQENKNQEIIKFLTEKGAKNGKEYGSLYEAVETGNLEKVKELVKNGADVNFKVKEIYENYENNTKTEIERTILELATHSCDYEGFPNTIKFLVENGAKINNEQHLFSFLWTENCLYSDILNLVEFLVKNGANVNESSILEQIINTSHIYGKEETIKIIKLLLDKGANINVKDREGKTILDNLYSYDPDKKEIAELLIKNGAKKSEELK